MNGREALMPFHPDQLAPGSRRLFERLADAIDPEDVDAVALLQGRVFTCLSVEVLDADGEFLTDVEVGLRAAEDVLERRGFSRRMRR